MKIELEDKLYKRDPIIARDGYIPNSVIRKRFNPPTHPPSPQKKQWTLKPVPIPDPKHMPDYWEPEDHSLSSEKWKFSERLSEPDKEVLLVVDNWEDESSSNSSRASSMTSNPWSEFHECHHGKNKINSDAESSNIESEVTSEFEESSEGDDSELVKYIEEEDDETVIITDAKPMANKPENTHYESERNTVNSTGRSSYERDYSRFSGRRDVPNIPPMLPQSSRGLYDSRGLYTIKPQMFPFQNIKINQESNHKVERSTRRGQSNDEKKQTSAVIKTSSTESSASELFATESPATESSIDLESKEELEIDEEALEFFQQLQQELLTLDDEMKLDVILQQLLKYLNHPDINIQQRAMEFLCIIHEKKGIPDVYREQAVAQIIEKVNSTPLSRVKMFSIEGLALVGYERQDCVTQLLINMADQNEDVQIAACEGLAHITGVRDKDAIIQKLDEMGITGVYNSREDEEQAMSLLEEKFKTEKDDYFQQRIRKWIESATPTPGINDFKADEIEHSILNHGSWEEIQFFLQKGRDGRKQHLSMYPDRGTSQSSDRLNELSFLSDQMDQNSMFDAFNPSGPNTFIEDDPTPITLGSASDLALSRGVSLYEPKSARSQGVVSGGGQSSKSKYNYRIDLMDRFGASVQPTERFEYDIPLYDIEQTPSHSGMPFNDLSSDIRHTSVNKTGILHMYDRKLDTPLSNAESTTDYDAKQLGNGISQCDDSPLNSTIEQKELNNDASMELNSSQFGTSPMNSNVDQNYEYSLRSQVSPGISGTAIDRQISIMSPTKAPRVVHESSEELITPKSQGSPRTQIDGKISQFSIENLYDVKISPETVIENLRLKSEGTNLSLVGPLPIITKQDTVSHDLDADSAISTLSMGESEPQTFTISEIGGFSEIVTTVSHFDSQYGDDDSDFTDLEKFDIDSGMWSQTNKKQRTQTTNTENTGKTQGYETGSAFKRGTAKTIGNEAGPAGTVVKRSHLTNPKVPNMYKYYDQRHLREQSGSQGSEELDLLRGEGQDGFGTEKAVPHEKSDIQSLAASIHSQEQSAGDAVSTHDSGISRDLSSDFSHERRAKLVAKSSRLSPVKSVTRLETSMQHSSTVDNSTQTSTTDQIEAQTKKEGDWRQFFQLPTAMERRRMNQVKKEKAAGKLRQTHLPPISYFTENLPLLPGEAGMRLLQTVRIGEKVPIDGDHRYRVEPLPGKLAVHTQNEDAGLSNFGIIQMQWTTGIPNFQLIASNPPSPPAVPRNSHQYGHHQTANKKEHSHRFRPTVEDLSSFLPHLIGQGQTTQSHSKNYEWEHPLPPPPEKESRTNLTNMKKDHDNYCKYYNLVKKQLHFYTSPPLKPRRRLLTKNLEEVRLPEVVVKQADMVSPKKDDISKQKSNLSKTKSNIMLPPIKLRQLVKVV